VEDFMIEKGRITALREALAGQVLLPTDKGYDEGRQVFNAMHDKRPAIITRCASTADVVSAVNFAREHELAVAVRSGGHSVAGLSSCDDGMLIDLAGLKRIDIDPDARTARTGGGVLWGEFDAATQQHGLHTPGGRATTTGVGGFTTGGGYGWTSSKYGLTCDNLISAEVVLANGRVATASEQENEDLFWGIRGGGGNFGVVTEFEYRLHPLGPPVLAGLTLFPLERASEVMRAWRDYVDDAPHELSMGGVMVTAPPEDFVPESLRGRVALALVGMYVGDPERGETIMRPIKDLRPAVDLIQPTPYCTFQAMIDAFAPRGHRSYWRGEYLEHLSDDAIDTFLGHGAELTAAARPLSQMVMFRIGQAVAEIPDEATAFSHRSARYLFHPIAMWQRAEDDERFIAATRVFCEAMRPFTTGGVYLNFTPEDRVRDIFGAGKYERLVAIKDRYDPGNLFRLNQNVKPSRLSGMAAHA
jgi:FAD/FMN-containing dehydrogenase